MNTIKLALDALLRLQKTRAYSSELKALLEFSRSLGNPDVFMSKVLYVEGLYGIALDFDGPPRRSKAQLQKLFEGVKANKPILSPWVEANLSSSPVIASYIACALVAGELMEMRLRDYES